MKLKKDKYRNARGGYSRLLEIKCSKCGSFVALYQKDGPGILKRMYIDRIFKPKSWAEYQKSEIKDVPKLICSKCRQLIGSPYVYEKEKRNALLMVQGSFSKKITKAK
ncbi:hypothetical protein C4544_07190 [candidate division WS5 bacterium]|uniref:Uncharacterized protein n=1 Tax=candidate division WS5 bacterium TaxID=2093353 RepID=A0A419DAJ9_9BACT|nr:MAG: hypothetical protein C4544_07190 [candidate division WS5 bacterium]